MRGIVTRPATGGVVREARSDVVLPMSGELEAIMQGVVCTIGQERVVDAAIAFTA
jgi:hypothetical protein